MARVKKWGRILFFLLLISLVFVAYGWRYWQNLKHELGLELDWQGLSLGYHGISFEHVNLTLPIDNQVLILQGENVSLSWSNATLKKATITIKASDLRHRVSENSDTPHSPIDIVNQLSWLPNTVELQQVTLNLPCPSGSCQAQGSLLLTQNNPSAALFNLFIQLKYQQHQLDLNAELFKRKTVLELTVSGLFDQQPLLSFSSQLDTNTADKWQGQLQLHKLNNALGLFTWLQQWLPQQKQINQLPDAMELKAAWQLTFSTPFMYGDVTLNAKFPEPWPIPSIGYAQGEIQAHITISPKQAISLNKLTSHIQLTQLDTTWSNTLPYELRPSVIDIQLNNAPHTTIDNKALVTIAITSTGILNTTTKATMLLDSNPPSISITDGLLTAHANTLKIDTYTIKKLQASLPFSFVANTSKATLTIDKQNHIKLQQLLHPVFNLKNVNTIADSAQIQFNYPNDIFNTNFDGLLNITTDNIQHELLKPVTWKAKETIKGTLKQLTVKGNITNSAGLTFTNQITTDYDKQLTIQAHTSDLFFKTNHALAKTFMSWPELLELNSGKANIKGSITIPLNKKSLQASANITLTDISGIYDRIELHKLTGSTNISLAGSELAMVFNQFSLKQANPGIDIGPVSFTGAYKANLNQLTQGNLSWTDAQLSLFKGRVWLNKGYLNFNQQPQQINVMVKDLQLEELFKAYPVDGLAGDGLIDGELPVIIDEGIEVEKGHLAARDSGLLHFNSPRIQALGQSNPSMQIITDALEDFRYTTLAAKANYRQGDLILAVNIQGQNPNIEKGRLINLNINLQENLPKLFTSLQLSDRVSEPIRKRVQEQLQKP